MSRYMLIMRSTPEAEKAMEEQNIDFNEVIESMGRYNEELIKAGVLLAGEGLTGPEEGFVVDFDADPPVVTDGPYTEAKELFNGFWILGRVVEGGGQAVGSQGARWVRASSSRCAGFPRPRTSRRTTRGSRRRSSGRPTWPRRSRPRRGPTRTSSRRAEASRLLAEHAPALDAIICNTF